MPGMGEPVGSEEAAGEGELVLDDERFALEGKSEDGGSCRWLLVPDVIHGYDDPIHKGNDDAEMLKDARIKTDKVISIVGEWLLAGPLSPAKTFRD